MVLGGGYGESSGICHRDRGVATSLTSLVAESETLRDNETIADKSRFHGEETAKQQRTRNDILSLG
jgi:hypothetical protein